MEFEDIIFRYAGTRFGQQAIIEVGKILDGLDG
jgi:hypothetical protein